MRVVEVGRVEQEEVYESVAPANRIIARATHIEQRIVALIFASLFDVVVSKHRVELYAFLEQAGERLLEVFDEVPAAAVGINVVADGQSEIKRRFLVGLQHSSGNSALVAPARAEIANHREPGLARSRAEDRCRFDNGRRG